MLVRSVPGRGITGGRDCRDRSECSRERRRGATRRARDVRSAPRAGRAVGAARGHGAAAARCRGTAERDRDAAARAPFTRGAAETGDDRARYVALTRGAAERDRDAAARDPFTRGTVLRQSIRWIAGTASNLVS